MIVIRKALCAALVAAALSGCSNSTMFLPSSRTHPRGVLGDRSGTIAGRPFGVAVSRAGVVYVTPAGREQRHARIATPVSPSHEIVDPASRVSEQRVEGCAIAVHAVGDDSADRRTVADVDEWICAEQYDVA